MNNENINNELKSFNKEPVKVIEQLKNNFSKNFYFLNKLIFNKTWIVYLILLIATPLLLLFLISTFGEWFTQEAWKYDSNLSGILSAAFATISISLPLYIGCFFTAYTIYGYRESNLISRIRMKGISKIQFFLIFLIFFSSITLLIIVLNLFVWTPIISIAFNKNNDLHYKIYESSIGIKAYQYGYLIPSLLFSTIALVSVGIFIGFYFSSWKLLSFLSGLIFIHFALEIFLIGFWNIKVDSSFWNTFIQCIHLFDPIYWLQLAPVISVNDWFQKGMDKWFTSEPAFMGQYFVSIILMVLTISQTILFNKKIVKFNSLK